MNECAVMSGQIPADGVLELLRAIESRRTSGELRFDAGDVDGVVRLDAGQLAFEQGERSDGKDVVELFLALRRGRFEVVQTLPELPISQGNATTREGSLSVHAPADLLNYAERAGLTGSVTLTHEGRSASVQYDRGELVGIVVDGLEAGVDLSPIFGWGDGTFRIEARPTATRLSDVSVESPSAAAEAIARLAPSRAARDRAATTLLRVVEVKLAAILEEARERRPRTVPPPPSNALASRPRTVPPTNPEAQVRVIFLGGAGEMLLHRDDLAVHGSVRDDDLLVAGVPRERTSATKAIRAPIPDVRARDEARDGIPRAAIVILAVVLALGLAAFVATLVDVS